MKNRKLIFQDQNHERIARDQIKQSLSVMQALCDRYHSMAKEHELPELTDANLREFWADIPAFIKKSIEDGIQVPSGLNKEKYLALCDVPQVDISGLLELYDQIAIKDCSLFNIVNGKVYLNEPRAKEHETAGNFYLETGSRKEQCYNAIVKLVDALNQLRSNTTGHQPFSTSFGFQADSLFTRGWDSENHSTVYRMDKQKTMTYLSKVLE